MLTLPDGRTIPVEEDGCPDCFDGLLQFDGGCPSCKRGKNPLAGRYHRQPPGSGSSGIRAVLRDMEEGREEWSQKSLAAFEKWRSAPW